jgi:hypothetical protein
VGKWIPGSLASRAPRNDEEERVARDNKRIATCRANQFDFRQIVPPEAPQQARKRLRQKANLSSGFKLISRVQISNKKYSTFRSL